MRFFKNIFSIFSRLERLEREVEGISTLQEQFWQIYNSHINTFHNEYNKVMEKAQVIKAENKKGKKGKVVFVENDFDIPEATCKRCNYTWTPRKETIDLCPKCKSKYWDKDYVRDVKRVAKKRHRKGNK